MDDGDFGNPAEIALDLHVVTDLERFEGEEHQAAGEILDGPAHGHANGHAACREKGGEGRDVDAQGADHRQDEHDPKKGADHALNEGGQGGVRLLLGKSFRDDLLCFPDQPGTDHVEQEGDQHLQAELEGGGSRTLEQFVGGCGADGLNELGTLCDQGIGRKLFCDLGLQERNQHSTIFL